MPHIQAHQPLRRSQVSAPSGLPSASLDGVDEGEGEGEGYDDDFADFDGPDVASEGLGSAHGSAVKPTRAARAGAAAAGGGAGPGAGEVSPRGAVEGDVRRMAGKIKELERLERTLHSSSAAALQGPAGAAGAGAGTGGGGGPRGAEVVRKSQSLAALRAEAAALVGQLHLHAGVLAHPGHPGHPGHPHPGHLHPGHPGAAPEIAVAHPSAVGGAAGAYGSSPERMRRLEEEVQRRKIATLRAMAKFDALQPLLHARHGGLGQGQGYGRGGGGLSPARGKGGRKGPSGAAAAAPGVVVVSDRIRALEERLARMEQQVRRSSSAANLRFSSPPFPPSLPPHPCTCLPPSRRLFTPPPPPPTHTHTTTTTPP